MSDPKVVFRVHALERMIRRRITQQEVRAVLTHGATIKEYADDRSYASELRLGFVGARPIHVVVAHNTDDDELIVITAYEPETDQWKNEFRERRK